jgi:DNA mismatch endonuclease (patch repair protein)
MKEIKIYIRDGRSPIPENELTSRVMSAIKGKNTKPELILRKALWNSGLRGYRLHWKKVPGRPDIAFPGKKIAIFVNGCFWHRCPHCQPAKPKSNSSFWKEKFKRNVERDQNKIQLLKRAGWQTITIWECQLNKNLNSYLSKIKKLAHKNE